MRKAVLALWMSLISGPVLAAGHGFACDLRALTSDERAQHAELGQQLLAAIQERRELPNGYAFRLAASEWLVAARWAALERKCCPFFAFELDSAPDGGPLWLRLTGRAGVKAFMREELGF